MAVSLLVAPAVDPVAGAHENRPHFRLQGCSRPDSRIEELTPPEQVRIGVLINLVDRVDAAGQLLQGLSSAPDLESARCAGQLVVDLIGGRGGRHSADRTIFPGVLPADLPRLLDAGLAFTAVSSVLEDEPQGRYFTLLLGGYEGWLTPPQRWDEIDASVAAWSPGNNSVGRLDGVMLRIVAWGLLGARAPSLDSARRVGQASTDDVQLSLQQARSLMALACSESDEPSCRELGF